MPIQLLTGYRSASQQLAFEALVTSLTPPRGNRQRVIANLVARGITPETMSN